MRTRTDSRRAEVTAVEPAVTVDAASTIIAWNLGAVSLFGHTEADVLGRKCWQVLAGRDHAGNRYCDASCPLLRMAARGEPIHSCDMSFRTARSGRVRAWVHSRARSNGEPPTSGLVHRFEPLESSPGPALRLPVEPLSAREVELLDLLSEGRRTDDMAATMGICEATVRNHVHNVLRKLGAHSRLEAVCRARNLGIVGDAVDSCRERR